MSLKTKSSLWIETSKADITGNVSKVAQELDKKIKGKYYKDLSLLIKDGGNNFRYSAKITEAGNVIIKSKFTLCNIGIDVHRPPYSCGKCDGCESKEILTELGDYLKSYNIGLEISAAR